MQSTCVRYSESFISVQTNRFHRDRRAVVFVAFLNVLQFLCVQLISRQELASRWQCLTTTPSLVVYQRTRYIMNHPTCQTVTLRETICLLFPSEIEIAQPWMFVAFDEILMVKCVYGLGITYYCNTYVSLTLIKCDSVLLCRPIA